jgi:hypothetical protein
MAKHITLLLILAAVPLLQSSNPQVEADAELIRLAEERDRIFKNLDWNQTATKKQWVFFYTLQALDVYSTHRGLKYDCIKEGNPLLGDRPTVSHMITHKTIFLSPYWMLQNEGIFTQRDITFVNGVGTVVVFNNFRLLEKAKERCTKR